MIIPSSDFDFAKYQDGEYGDHCIINGDCLNVLDKMPDNAIDLVWTSPPFKEEDVNCDYWALYDLWFAGMSRIAGKVLGVIHSATKLNALITKYPPKRTMIWSKGMVKYSWRYNPILVYQMEESYSVNKRIWSDVFGVPPLFQREIEKVHKYQDPLKLYSTIFSMFKECAIVLDPFGGSCTTMLAAVNCGMRSICIEIEYDRCVAAEQRMAQEVLSL